MKTLILQLVAPLQSWGDDSKLSTRQTRNFPSKSGVIGLLASALGRARNDSVDDLMELRFGVRADQQGTHLRDYHTAEFPGKQTISHRYYLSDWKFLCALSGDDKLIDQLATAVQSPVWPLFLGRRSCPPSAPVFIGITDAPVEEVLREHPWIASENYMHMQQPEVSLLWTRDPVDEGDPISELRSDFALSFDPAHRRYKKRALVVGQSTVQNPLSRWQRDPEDSAIGPAVSAQAPSGSAATGHDEFALLAGD